MAETRVLGRIDITDDAIADLAGHTAMQSYGVVGLDYPSLSSRLKRFFRLGSQSRGIRVTQTDGAVAIDLFIIVENGTNIREISRNLVDQITYTIAKHTGLAIKEVNVHISNIKI